MRYSSRDGGTHLANKEGGEGEEELQYRRRRRTIRREEKENEIYERHLANLIHDSVPEIRDVMHRGTLAAVRAAAPADPI